MANGVRDQKERKEAESGMYNGLFGAFGFSVHLFL